MGTCPNGEQIIRITELGKVRILKIALNELSLEKPSQWNGSWWIVTYDLPKKLAGIGNRIREYLKAWKFYPLQKSVFLHAYPCKTQIDFLREYLRVSKYVRIIKVSEIENDQIFRDFFGV